MRIAILGAARSGKTQLARQLARTDGGWTVVDDPGLAGDTHLRDYDLTLLTGLDLCPPPSPDATRSAARQAADQQLRAALQRHGIRYAVVYGTGSLRTQNALEAVAQYLGQPRTRNAHDTPWTWSCDTCSDPDCEHRLFSRWLPPG